MEQRGSKSRVTTRLFDVDEAIRQQSVPGSSFEPLLRYAIRRIHELSDHRHLHESTKVPLKSSGHAELVCLRQVSRGVIINALTCAIAELVAENAYEMRNSGVGAVSIL